MRSTKSGNWRWEAWPFIWDRSLVPSRVVRFSATRGTRVVRFAATYPTEGVNPEITYKQQPLVAGLPLGFLLV